MASIIYYLAVIFYPLPVSDANLGILSLPCVPTAISRSRYRRQYPQPDQRSRHNDLLRHCLGGRRVIGPRERLAGDGLVEKLGQRLPSLFNGHAKKVFPVRDAISHPVVVFEKSLLGKDGGEPLSFAIGINAQYV